MLRKNDWPLQEVCALVIDMCAVLLERPNILTTTIVAISQMILLIILDEDQIFLTYGARTLQKQHRFAKNVPLLKQNIMVRV